MKAVVLAGGFGTRILPLTYSRPKPMLPIVNKPMMEHTMMKLRDTGIKDFIVLLYFKPEVIMDYFGDGKKFGINISYIIPEDDYGTAGAVKLAQEKIADDNFIIISGDLVTDFDFEKIFSYHEKSKSNLTITLTSVINPLEFGVVIANEDGKIEKFLEKPSWGEVFSDTINTGIYILEPEILEYIPKNTNYDFAKDLFPLLMKKGIDLMGYHASGYWKDVGNPDSYREVHNDILNNIVDFNFHGFKKVFRDGVLYSDEKYELKNRVEIIDNVVIGKNVKIGKGTKLHNTVIGDNSVIGDYCKIRNSVIWENSKVDNNVVLDNSVICNNTTIGHNTKAKAGLILAQGSKIGTLVSVDKDITIWPNKIVDDASIISNNVIWIDKYKNSIFENGSVCGISNIEISCEMVTKLAEAFASQLPIGSNVYVSRDHHNSSRMLKRAFLGGVLASGINIIDMHTTPSSILRYNLAVNEHVEAGIHFREHTEDPASIKIIFFNADGLKINSSMAKNVEKAFFKEKFRRVNYQDMGEIIEHIDNNGECSMYENAIYSRINKDLVGRKKFHLVSDLMHGSAADIFPKILNNLGIKNILLNAYSDDKKLGNIKTREKRSKSEVAQIVKTLGSDLGFIIYPNAQNIVLVTDEGEALEKEITLLVILYLINYKKCERKTKVLLPTWAPDIMDSSFTNLEIERSKYSEYDSDKLKTYDFIATVDGNYAFTEFTIYHDSIYLCLKIIEMLIKHDLKLSDIVNKIEPFYYCCIKLPCTQSLKGTMIRRFLEDAKNKESSSLDGVKIWKDNNEWILMIPDQYNDLLNLYIQAQNRSNGKELYEKYKEKIDTWTK